MNLFKILTERVKTAYRDTRGHIVLNSDPAQGPKAVAQHQHPESHEKSSTNLLSRLYFEASKAHARHRTARVESQLSGMKTSGSNRFSRLVSKKRGSKLRNDPFATLVALPELANSKLHLEIISVQPNIQTQRSFTDTMPRDDKVESYHARNVTPDSDLPQPSADNQTVATCKIDATTGPHGKVESVTEAAEATRALEKEHVASAEPIPGSHTNSDLIPTLEVSAIIMDAFCNSTAEPVATIDEVIRIDTPVLELPSLPRSPTFEQFEDGSPTEDQGLDHWGIVNLILPAAVEKLAMEHAPLHAEDAVYIGDTAGQHNRVFLVEYQPNGEQRIFRIPASGWAGKWCEKDKYQLTRVNNIMQYLKNHTKVPVPEVFHWDTELKNSIGAPYTIMERVNGVEPSQLWFKDIFDEEDEQDEEIEPLDMDFRSGFQYRPVNRSLEEKRGKILRSLASAVAELKDLKFDKMGALSFPEGLHGHYEIGPREDLCFGRKRQNAEVDESLAKMYDFTEDFLDARFRHITQKVYMEEGEDEYLWAGLYRLYKILVRCLPLHFDYDVPETFVLAPPDFGSQNLLCDDDGNITAILDWDTVETRPRMFGWCLPPDWLSVDWFGNQNYTWPNQVMAPNDLGKYRQQYAQYLREACKDDSDSDDWKYTEKAPMFDAILRTMTYLDQDHMLETMTNLLNTFLPRVDHKQLIIQLGKDIKATDISRMIHWSEPMRGAMENFFLKGFSDLCGTTPKYETFDEDECNSMEGNGVGEESGTETEGEIETETGEESGIRSGY